MMYRTQLVPRAWTWLRLVGGPLIIISGTVVMFGGNPATAALKGAGSIPEALWNSFSAFTAPSGASGATPPILSGNVSTPSGSAV